MAGTAESSPDSQAEELEKLIRYHRDLYYNRQPVISDEEFDRMVDELRILRPESPVLKEVGAPAAPEVTGLPTKRHRIPMGSLDKVPEDRLEHWAAKAGPAFLVQEKLDGISMEFVYQEGQLADAITRGDGLVGEVVTQNARLFQGTVERLPLPLTGSVRGEVICRRSVFSQHFTAIGFANARNTVSGTVRKKYGDLSLNRHFEVHYYDLIGEGLEFASERQKMEHLRDRLGLNLAQSYFDQDLEGVRRLYREYLGEGGDGLRAGLDYDIDGLVVRADSIPRQRELGEIGNRPRYAMAYKFPSEVKETILKEVEWSLGIGGRLTPVAKLEPVSISGVTVTSATLHNLDYVRALGVRAGDRVQVERAGDVIPQVVRVVESRGGAEPVPPETCPRCQGPVLVEGKYLRCPNPDCGGKVYGDVRRWVVELGIDALGEKWIANLIEVGLVKDPADLYLLREEDLVKLERMGEILARKVLRNVAETRSPPLDRYLAALNIPEFSHQRAQMLIDAGHGTLEKLQALSVEDITRVKGFKETLAGRIHRGLAARSERIARLKEVGVSPQPAPPRKVAAGPLSGKTFCFTGAVKAVNPSTGKRWTRKELQSLVESLGGRNLDDVHSGLDYLVMADPESTSTKAQKARTLGIKILGEEEFLGMVEGMQ